MSKRRARGAGARRAAARAGGPGFKPAPYPEGLAAAGYPVVIITCRARMRVILGRLVVLH